MLSLVDGDYTFQLPFLVLLVVLIWIVPLLPLTRAEDRVKCRTYDINASADHKYSSPFSLRWLKAMTSRVNVEAVRYLLRLFQSVKEGLFYLIFYMREQRASYRSRDDISSCDRCQ